MSARRLTPADRAEAMYARAGASLHQARVHNANGDPISEAACLAVLEDCCLRLRGAASLATPSRPNARSGISRRRFRLYRACWDGSWEHAGSGSAAELAGIAGIKPRQVYALAKSGDPTGDGAWRVEELRTPGF